MTERDGRMEMSDMSDVSATDVVMFDFLFLGRAGEGGVKWGFYVFFFNISWFIVSFLQ